MRKDFGLAVTTLWWRELVRFWRERARVAGFVGSPLLFWLIIGSGFGDLAFFFPGAITLTVMVSATFSTMSLIEDRREGFLLAVLVSPAPRSAMVLGKVLGASTLAWIQGLLLLAFLPLAGLRPPAASVLAAALIIYVISFSFTALGFLIAWHMDSSQGFHAVMNLVLFPLWMVSGAIFSPASAHGWMQVLMQLNPLTYSLAALRHFLAPAADPHLPPLLPSLIVTAAGAVALVALATLTARRQPKRSFA